MDSSTFHDSSSDAILSALPNLWGSIQVVKTCIIKNNVPNPMSLVTRHPDYETIHHQLGHISDEAMRHISDNVEGAEKIYFPNKKHICCSCTLGKLYQRSFPENSKHSSETLGLIHSDLLELSTLLYSKYKWVITFLDNYSSYCRVAFLHKKSDAAEAIKAVFQLWLNTTFYSVKCLHTDNGGEYMTSELQSFLREQGIVHETSTPHVHQQNSRAERLNRTLLEKVQYTRLEACLPDSWWEFAFATATHVYNCTPIKCLKWKTPQEIFTGEKPKISHLYVFGCGAYVYLPNEVCTNKLTSRSELMIFIGYEDNGYRFIHHTQGNVIFYSTQAIFDEGHFPRCPLSHPREQTPPGRLIPEIEPSAPRPSGVDEPAPTPFPPTPAHPRPFTSITTGYLLFVMGALIL